ncbi:hypothetical protein LOK49_LG08G02282 [Camellia lanceoleosa]|uniref:Uncharacterized protein n=1 Tax=Camellia lanceoleosa TaxID=1840588 RepID=A0ACC0GPA0_9ERIC|nr:hypothetical protein LOK49_LG08G02282 [Camellia lanceoleosa]
MLAVKCLISMKSKFYVCPVILSSTLRNSSASRENVEPSELEEASLKSSLIQQIVVIGQDQCRLGAIIVPNKKRF